MSGFSFEVFLNQFLVFVRFAAFAAVRLYNKAISPTGSDLHVLGNEGKRLVLQHLFLFGCFLREKLLNTLLLWAKKSLPE